MSTTELITRPAPLRTPEPVSGPTVEVGADQGPYEPATQLDPTTTRS